MKLMTKLMNLVPLKFCHSFRVPQDILLLIVCMVIVTALRVIFFKVETKIKWSQIVY